jgi:hypothetical protein
MFSQTLGKNYQKPIVRLNAEKTFDDWLEHYNGYLPSAQARWCTRVLKIKPMEEYIGDDDVMLYIGIRYDEDRSGYISKKKTIVPVYPFKDDKLVLSDILTILDNSGIGLPSYYEWRSRSGCYMCFFQRHYEWIGLLHRHPDLFREAMEYEKTGCDGEKCFTWIKGESLSELSKPERVADIIRKHEKKMQKQRERKHSGDERVVMEEVLDGEDTSEPCVICSI